MPEITVILINKLWNWHLNMELQNLLKNWKIGRTYSTPHLFDQHEFKHGNSMIEVEVKTEKKQNIKKNESEFKDEVKSKNQGSSHEIYKNQNVEIAQRHLHHDAPIFFHSISSNFSQRTDTYVDWKFESIFRWQI